MKIFFLSFIVSLLLAACVATVSMLLGPIAAVGLVVFVIVYLLFWSMHIEYKRDKTG